MRRDSPHQRLFPVLLAAACLGRAPAARAAEAQIEPLDPPAVLGAMAPNLFAARSGVLLSWIEPAPAPPEGVSAQPGDGAEAGARAMCFRVSRWDGLGWSEPTTIARSDGFFANWADVPSLVEAADGSLLAHWLQKSGPQTYAYDVQLAHSMDSGRTWVALGPLNDDRTQTEHGFVSLLPAPGGVRAFWLDGRETGGAEHANPKGDHAAAAGAMTLRTARISERIEQGERIDSSVCDCCPTAAAMTARGPIVVYRDRSPDELRDISIIRATDGGWSQPRAVARDGWKIEACPVNGPAVAAWDSRVAVAWYTGVRPGPLVRVAFSSDDGETFGPAWVVDGPNQTGDPLGRVGIVVDEDGSAIVSWLDGEKSRAAVRVMRAAPGGMLGTAVTVGYTAASRDSGVPRIAVHGDWLMVAWTEPGSASGVRVARVRRADIPQVSYQTWR